MQTHTSYITQPHTATGFGFSSTKALESRGPACLGVVLGPAQGQDIALPLYMKRIHPTSLHRMNYVQSVTARVTFEGLNCRDSVRFEAFANIKTFLLSFVVKLLTQITEQTVKCTVLLLNN